MKKLYLLFALMFLCNPTISHAKDKKPVVKEKVPADDAEVEDEGSEDEGSEDEGSEDEGSEDEGKKSDGDDEEEADDADDEEAEEADDDEEADEADKPKALPSASKTPMVGKVGKTMGVEIDSRESQDFNLDLPKGQFFVYLDAQRLGKGSLTSSIDASLYLLKRNGAEMPQYSGYLIYWNSRERVSRNGEAFSLSKPTGVRFRVKNDSDGANNFWLTVVPAQPATFLPFSFGSPVKAAKIGPNKGTGSTLEIGEFEYLRATIPAGKWSVSLGARTTGGSCYVSMFSLNARGVDYRDSFSIIGVGKDERKEEIITLAKPTTLIFRVANEGAADTNTISYDVTIEPSTD